MDSIRFLLLSRFTTSLWYVCSFRWFSWQYHSGFRLWFRGYSTIKLLVLCGFLNSWFHHTGGLGFNSWLGFLSRRWWFSLLGTDMNRFFPLMFLNSVFFLRSLRRSRFLRRFRNNNCWFSLLSCSQCIHNWDSSTIQTFFFHFINTR